jgi:hypothetical protein
MVAYSKAQRLRADARPRGKLRRDPPLAAKRRIPLKFIIGPARWHAPAGPVAHPRHDLASFMR